MSDREGRTASSPLRAWSGRIALALALVMMTVNTPAVLAQSPSSEATTKKAGQAKKPRPAVVGQSGKAAGAKAKRARVTVKAAEAAKPADESVAQAAPASNAKAPAPPPARTAETVDFDADAEDIQRMEPGFDLIQAAPRRARHRSLVPATPSPEDSVVNRP